MEQWPVRAARSARAEGLSLHDAEEAFRRALIDEAIRDSGGRVAGAARLLHTHRNTLHYEMSKRRRGVT